jgi:hypothetical protein
MKLLAVSADIHSVIADIRLVTPLRALCTQQGWSLALRSFHDCLHADLSAADVLVVQRAVSARGWRLQRAMRQRGAAVVYDIDDLLTEIAPHISNHTAMKARQAELRRCLAESDVVSVATARLGKLLADTVALPVMQVVPNYSLADEQPLPTQGPGRLTLLLASSEHLDTDFIFPALRALQGPGLQIVVVGPPGAAFEAAGLVVRREPLRPRADFLALARSLPNPVAVIPLEDSRFAAGKSAVKWFDYAEIGIPTLASRHSPYLDVIDDGHTGWLVDNDAATWLRALQAVIAEPVERLRVAAAARQVVRERHGLQQSVAAWQRAIELALLQRASARLEPPTLRERLQTAVGRWLEGGVIRLRAINRARLARRQQARR